jgi:plasmid stability protein
MATLQVRNIDDNLYEALRRRAKEQNRSISQEVIRMLREHLGAGESNRERRRRALSVAGQWLEPLTPEAIVADLRAERMDASNRFRDDLFD